MGLFSGLRNALFGKPAVNERREQGDVEVGLREEEVIVEHLTRAIRDLPRELLFSGGFFGLKPEFENARASSANYNRWCEALDPPIDSLERMEKCLSDIQPRVEAFVQDLPVQPSSIYNGPSVLQSGIFDGLAKARTDRIRSLGYPDRVWVEITTKEERDALDHLKNADVVLRDAKRVVDESLKTLNLYGRHQQDMFYGKNKRDVLTIVTAALKNVSDLYSTFDTMKKNLELLMAMERAADEGFRRHKQLAEQTRRYG